MIAHLEPAIGGVTFQILDVIPTEQIPEVGQTFRFTVTSWSMFPTVQQGDVLTIESPDRIRVGDIIVVGLSGRLVCHRVTLIQADGMVRTRGDAASREDAPIRLHDVIGRVTAVQRGSRRFVPQPSPALASMADRARLKLALLRTSLSERLVGSALSILARLKRIRPVRAVAMFFLARHVRFYLGVRVPLQFAQAYRFMPLATAAPEERGREGDDVVIQARLGRLRLGTFHPASERMHLRTAVEGLGLEAQFHRAHQRLAQ